MMSSPAFGSRLWTVRSKRRTVLIEASHGAWRNHALAGTAVNSIMALGLAVGATERFAP